jgi:hypothetical protein
VFDDAIQKCLRSVSTQRLYFLSGGIYLKLSAAVLIELISAYTTRAYRV